MIVSIGPVHLELLGSIEAIAAAKAELIAALAPGATAVVPAGEPLLDAASARGLETVTFGPGGDVDYVSQSRDARRDRRAGGAASSSSSTSRRRTCARICWPPSRPRARSA